MLAPARAKAMAMGALALAVLPVRASARDHHPEPVVTGIVVHFYVTGEKKLEDGVAVTALDKDGTVVARSVVQPAESDWLPRQEVQVQVNPTASIPISHLNGGKLHIDSGNPTPWATNVEVFATLNDGTTRQIVSETMQPVSFNWTGQNGSPFWEGSFINCGRPEGY